MLALVLRTPVMDIPCIDTTMPQLTWAALWQHMIPALLAHGLMRLIDGVLTTEFGLQPAIARSRAPETAGPSASTTAGGGGETK